MTTIDIIAAVGAQLGECPIWSISEQALYWEDIDGRKIHRHDASTGANTERTLPARPGSFAFTSTPGRLAVAMEHQLVAFDWDSGDIAVLADLEPAGTGNRLNDGRCDPAGRYIVGSMYETVSDNRTTGILHQVNADGSSTQLRDGIGVSNGTVFDAERGRMYFVDTPTMQILCWDYDADTGQRTNERLFFDYTGLGGYPDGACLDADGCYWSASIYGSAVTRITPDGKVDRRIELPILTPTMPCFGGPDLSTMYVTSLVDAEHEGRYATSGDMRAGTLIALDAGVQGVPETPFAG